MGYTHYFEFTKLNESELKKIKPSYDVAIRQCHRIIRHWNKIIKKIDEKSPHRLSGYSAHTPVGKYRGIKLNGTQEMAHESFDLRESYELNGSFNFCKTNRKPYDTVVVACLITLKHYLGECVTINSDGNSSEWESGLLLARTVLRIKTDNPIKKTKECA